MMRSRWSLRLSLAFMMSVPLAVLSGACSDGSGTTTGSTNPSGMGGNGGNGEGGSGGTGASNAGGAAGSGGAGGQEVKRGPVSFISTPPLTARVGLPYAYVAKAVQAMAQPGDVITYALATAPAGMTIAASGDVAWTPIKGQEGPQNVSIVATGPDGQTAQQDFTIDVEAAVAVSSLWPAAGSATGGEPVKIQGHGFIGNVGVLFDDVPAQTVTVVNDTEVDVLTPLAIAKTRIVRVTINGAEEATFSPGFTHLPVALSTDVTQTKLASTLKVQGVGFETANVDPNQLSIAARAGTRRKIVTSTSPGGELTFALGVGNSESTLATGALAVEVNGLRSNYLPLTITDATLAAELAVTAVDAPHAVGETMILTGAGFAGLLPADLSVTFAGSAAPAQVTAINAAGTQVDVKVPADAVTGPISLAAPGRLPGRSYVAASITGTTPVLSVLDATPAGGPPGSALVLLGTGFDLDPLANKVSFDGMAAKVLSSEANRLVVEVPKVAFGPAVVTIDAAGQSIKAPTFGVTGGYAVIAGGGPEETEIGDGGDPKLASLESTFVTTDAANNYYLADRKRVRVINNGAAALVAFGKTIMPNTIQTVAQAPADVTAVAIHPVTGDVYFSTGSKILRAPKATGIVSDYAGTNTSGNGGNGGNRTNASFNGITDLLFTPDGGILVIADNNNGTIRGINTTGTSSTTWGVPLAADAVDVIATLSTANPLAMTLDPQGSLYATTFIEVRKIPFDRVAAGGAGDSVKVAGGGTNTSLPAEGCPAITTSLGTNDGIVIDPIRGDAFLGSRHGLVRRIVKSGGTSATTIDTDDCVEVIAGSWAMNAAIPNAGYAGDGGPAKSATLSLFSRPFVDRNGALLLPAEGRLRRVTFDAMGVPGLIQTIAGLGPSKLNNLPALSLRALNSLSGLRVDAANDRYIYTSGGYAIAQNRTTNLLSVLAGTGNLGNTIGANAMATASDLGVLRGIELVGSSLYLLEATIPRISRVDLMPGTLTVVAGDGKVATNAELQMAGPASAARVAINTGAPKAALGPNGAFYYADSNLVRVINVTAQTLTTFGVTIPPGSIDDLPLSFGANLSGLSFAANGDMYVASYDSNAISRVRAAGPFVVETVVVGDSQRYGLAKPGALSTLSLNRPSDIAFLPNGDLLIANDFGHSLTVVEPDGNGDIGPTSQFAHVFGSGAPGRLAATGPSLASTPRGVRAVTVDGTKLVLIAGERVVTLDMP